MLFRKALERRCFLGYLNGFDRKQLNWTELSETKRKLFKGNLQEKRRAIHFERFSAIFLSFRFSSTDSTLRIHSLSQTVWVNNPRRGIFLGKCFLMLTIPSPSIRETERIHLRCSEPDRIRRSTPKILAVLLDSIKWILRKVRFTKWFHIL